MPRTINQTLQTAASFLHALDHPQMEAEVLLGSLLGRERAWLKTHDQESLPLLTWLRFRYWCYQRAKGVPVAYIRGYQDWHGQRFLVNPSVLIPRDETETLLTHILDTKYKILPDTILDIGTGSGCLAIELKRAFPEAEVLGLDISQSALKVAQKNAQMLLSTYPPTFKHSDLLSAVPKQSHYDLIVANLPYVPETIEITTEVKQEPHGAIFSGTDGLDHYRRLAHELNDKSITFGQLWLEFLPSQKDQINKIFDDYVVEFKADVAGNEFFACVAN